VERASLANGPANSGSLPAMPRNRW
jgi:hypothetical protein